MVRERRKEPKEKKVKIVEELKDKFQQSQIVILTDYQGPLKTNGLKVKDMNMLRRKIRDNNGEFKVVKNTLTQLALKECGYEELDSYLIQATGIVFGYDDPVSPTKALLEFAKEHRTSKDSEGLPLIKVGIIKGRVIDASQIKEIANLPPRNELVAKLLGGMKWPISGFVNCMTATIRNWVYLLEAIRKKQAQES